MCQTLPQIQLPLDLEPTKIQALLSTVADILTVRVSLCHLNAILRCTQNHTPEDKTIFKHLSSFETRVRKVSARKRIATDEQDREGDSESDPAANPTSASAKKVNALAEKKRKMVARSETEAEERSAPGKKKRKNSVTASNAVDGDGQDVHSFVPVRATEVKKSRARCVLPCPTDLKS